MLRGKGINKHIFVVKYTQVYNSINFSLSLSQ